MQAQLLRARKLAFIRQDGRCFYCTVKMSLDTSTRFPRLQCTAEHLLPRSLGGKNGTSNIVAA